MQTSLTTTSTPFDLSALDRASIQPSTRAQYVKALSNMMTAGVDPTDYEALQRYADGLPTSSKAFLKSALRLLVMGVERGLKAGATPENLPIIQASLLRLDAMKEAINVPQSKGTKAHTWLSPRQVQEITSLPGQDVEGKRDYIVLGLLLGAGLRREELSQLTFDALKQQPTKSGKMRDVLEVIGKGNKSRVIPISEKLGAHLREWMQIVGPGRIARSLGMSKTLGESMSAVSIFELVNKYGARIGIDTLAPHDLRRTFAQLGFEAGISLTQISTLLGHSNVATTQKYLNLALDLEATASDFVPLA